jgi:Tol biopolymer transport system component
MLLLLILIVAGVVFSQAPVTVTPVAPTVTVTVTPAPTAASLVYAANGNLAELSAAAYGTYQLYINEGGRTLNDPLTDRAGDAFAPDWSPDCRWIVYSRDHAYIEVIRSSGGEPQRLTRGGSEHSPVWLPDGSAILYASRADRAIYRMQPDGTLVQPILTDINAASLELSADGRWLLFIAEADSMRQVYVAGVDGADLRPLLPGTPAHDATWSPDGEQIALATTDGLYVTTPAGQPAVPLTITGPLAGFLADGYEVAGLQWSPDGTRLALTITSARLALAVATPVPAERVGPQLAVLDLDSGNLQLLSSGFYHADPDWKPCPS